MGRDIKVRGVLNIRTKLWPSGIVPYIINTTSFTSTAFTTAEIDTIKNSMKTFEDQVRVNGKDCIRFVPRTTETKYLNIMKSGWVKRWIY